MTAGNGSSTPRSESRWPVLATMAVAAALPLFMPAAFVPGPGWVIPALQFALLVAVALSDPDNIDERSRWVRAVRLTFILTLVLAAIWATVGLIDDILHDGPATSSATALLRAGGLVWIDTVLAFGFLYWELDGGGPGERANRTPDYPDLAFPQHMNPRLAPPGWRPLFPDYLYLGLTNAVAFSPTDVMPMTVWAKITMAIQSMTSLLILALVIARAVNVLT